MITSYLQIMSDSLDKKKKVLLEIKAVNQKQSELISCEELDMETFDQTMNEKDPLIEQINELNDGFESTYQRVREELMANKEKYKPWIDSFKSKISEVMDLSVSIQAEEERNRQGVARHLQNERLKLRRGKQSMRAAMDYYRNSSRLNTIDPQLMDHKK